MAQWLWPLWIRVTLPTGLALSRSLANLNGRGSCNSESPTHWAPHVFPVFHGLPIKDISEGKLYFFLVIRIKTGRWGSWSNYLGIPEFPVWHKTSRIPSRVDARCKGSGRFDIRCILSQWLMDTQPCQSTAHTHTERESLHCQGLCCCGCQWVLSHGESRACGHAAYSFQLVINNGML